MTVLTAGHSAPALLLSVLPSSGLGTGTAAARSRPFVSV